jgi:hypothetical protein
MRGKNFCYLAMRLSRVEWQSALNFNGAAIEQACLNQKLPMPICIRFDSAI